MVFCAESFPLGVSTNERFVTCAIVILSRPDMFTQRHFRKRSRYATQNGSLAPAGMLRHMLAASVDRILQNSLLGHWLPIPSELIFGKA
jgi:hypothetical protein